MYLLLEKNKQHIYRYEGNGDDGGWLTHGGESGGTSVGEVN
jgi:hypothetical protein